MFFSDIIMNNKLFILRKAGLFMKVTEKIAYGINKITGAFAATAQDQNGKVSANEKIDEKITALSRQAASEGAVLLKNNGVLPIKKGNCVSVFSRLQKDWLFVGYGSGGDVNCNNKVSLLEAMRKSEDIEINEELAKEYEIFCKKNPVNQSAVWGTWEFSLSDLKLRDDIVEAARKNSDTAIYIIGRGTGEDRDAALEKGSYYLSNEEIANLDLITKYFDKVVVLLNIGNIIDMAWAESYGDKISAILCVWQGGMGSGNAVCDLLCGKPHRAESSVILLQEAILIIPQAITTATKISMFMKKIYLLATDISKPLIKTAFFIPSASDSAILISICSAKRQRRMKTVLLLQLK